MLGRDVAPARGLDQVLLPVGDLQVAVPVDLPDVAGVEPPAGLEHRGRLLGLPVVPVRDVRAASEDLPVLGDLQVDPGERPPHGPELVRPGMVAGQDGARLGQPVAFQDQDAGGVEELGDLRRERRAPRDAEPQAPSEGRTELPEDQPVRHLPLDAQGPGNRPPFPLEAARAAPDRQGPVEDAAAERRRGRHAGQDLRVHLLEHARHAADEVRRDLAQVLRQPLDALRERRDQAEPDPEEALHPGKGMRQREEQEMRVALAHPSHPRDHVERREMVPVGLHDPLRRASRARRVDDGRDVPRLDRPEPLLEGVRGMRAAAERPERLPVEDARPAAPASGRGRSLDHDDGVEARDVRGGGQRLPELLRVLDEEGPHLGVPGDVGERLGRIRRVHGDRDPADRQDGEVCPDPLRPRLGEDAHGVPWLATERDEPEPDLADLVSELTPGDVLPAASGLDALGDSPAQGGCLTPEQRPKGFPAHGWCPPLQVLALMGFKILNYLSNPSGISPPSDLGVPTRMTARSIYVDAMR